MACWRQVCLRQEVVACDDVGELGAVGRVRVDVPAVPGGVVVDRDNPRRRRGENLAAEVADLESDFLEVGVLLRSQSGPLPYLDGGVDEAVELRLGENAVIDDEWMIVRPSRVR